MATTLSNPNIGGADLKIPIYKDMVAMTANLTDGEFALNDITSVADIGLGILSAALDPIGSVVGAIVDWLLDLLIQHCQPLQDALNKLLGNPDEIQKISDDWRKYSEELANQANQHAGTAGDMPSWQGPGANAYRQILSGTNDAFKAGSSAANSMSTAVQNSGTMVAAFRELIWGMIKDFIKAVVSAALKSLMTGPAAPAVFGGWLAGKVGAMITKVGKKLKKLMEALSKFAKKCGIATDKFDEFIDGFGKLVKQLGKNSGSGMAPLGGPKPSLPGKTDLGDTHPGVKDAIDAYNKGKKTKAQDLTGGEADPEIQDI
ncbi:WXG100 family type VII secretion target [Parenemella sanctibonifatiensis]|uniref:Outer membrane channel protein CpnT-like N-terminal domain-containing protein n=1 Tax=Parenemella sanctibonifatiensis TaxID=2016505 RepID=A0A255ELQ2_9ACTN|nr:hypothetical protein [Parenemella sanctibonifatiensis]OYN84725.1 hypothetical protein CGZ92_12970 [Parenemella sanctibonifatiensis]OYN92478.1 hypothetical protein CGZ91_03030 [Parenemella sanctibonifatiensis]